MLKFVWLKLMPLVATNITLLKPSDSIYDEDWDEGRKNYEEHSIPARVQYQFSDREITQLGEDLHLDAILTVRNVDLSVRHLTIATQDHFRINGKEYRITKILPVVIKSEPVGLKIGVIEVL